MKYLTFLFGLCLSFSLFAQAPPQGISYQAVARNSDGSALAESGIGVRISILANGMNGTLMWEETHNAVTDQYGLFSLVIGQGDFTGGNSPTFDLIQWGVATYFLKVEIDTGDGLWELMGVSQLLSVPYAFYAEKAGDVDDDDADPTNELITSITTLNDSLIINEAGTEFIIDLGELLGDNTIGDECISLAQLSGTNLNIVECGESYVIPLESLVDDGDWTQGENVVYNDTDFIGIGTDTPQSTLEVTGSVAFEVSQVQGPINVLLDENNHVVIANVTNADVTINLPSAALCYGRQYTIKAFSSGAANDLNLLTFGNETIDGINDITLTSITNQAFTLISDGVAWWVIHGSIAP
jgi:hypothetical protein